MESGAPLRADAARNRDAIVAAASELFTARGADIPLEEVAREAGVGIGTLYRRFPTRDRLVEAVFEQKMKRYAERVAFEADRAKTDAWGAFSTYVMFILEQQADDQAFSEVTIAPLTGSAVFAEYHDSALRSSLLLVHRAKRAGAVRPDFEHNDLGLLLLANAGLVKSARISAPDAWRRFGAYMLDAFRHRGDQPLPRLANEWARTTVVGSDAGGSDVGNSDAAGPDAAGSAAADSDAARTDAANSDAARSDAARSDPARSDAAHSDAANSDAAGSDAARSDAAPSDAAESPHPAP